MEMKYVVPDMAQSFGTLEFAGESEPVFERDKNNRRVLARRSYNLYSDVQKGENVFQENKRKAQLEAYKIGFKLLFVVIWLMAIGMFSRNVEWCAMFMLISVSLIYALVLFLSNYLLYRYEKRE